MKTHRARQGMKILVLLFALGLSVPGRAQLGNEGSIEGIVTDSSGAVIPGATIVVSNDARGIQRTVKTNSSGLFNVPALPPGVYTLWLKVVDEPTGRFKERAVDFQVVPLKGP